MPCSFPISSTPQVESEEPKRVTLERVHHFRFLRVQLYPEGFELLLKAVHGPFGPAALRVVPAHGDHDIVRKPVVVHGLVLSLCRFLANLIKYPVHIVEIDVGRQRAERTPLGNTDLSADIHNLFHQM